MYTYLHLSDPSLSSLNSCVLTDDPTSHSHRRMAPPLPEGAGGRACTPLLSPSLSPSASRLLRRPPTVVLLRPSQSVSRPLGLIANERERSHLINVTFMTERVVLLFCPESAQVNEYVSNNIFWQES